METIFAINANIFTMSDKNNNWHMLSKTSYQLIKIWIVYWLLDRYWLSIGWKIKLEENKALSLN